MSKLVNFLTLPESTVSQKKFKAINEHLARLNIVMPGNCIYNHNILTIPDVINQEDIPYKSNRSELEDCIHFYNYIKSKTYDAIRENQSLVKIKELSNYANNVRWSIVRLCRGIISTHLKKHPMFSDVASVGYCGLHRALDRFNPTLGYAPSTYLYYAVSKTLYKESMGNANMINLKLTIDSELIKKCNGVHYDNIIDTLTVNELIEKIPCSKHRKIVRMRYLDGMGLGQIAMKLGVSKQRISQIIIKSVDLMRDGVTNQL